MRTLYSSLRNKTCSPVIPVMIGFAVFAAFSVNPPRVQAESVKWPTEHHSRQPLIKIISPGRPQSIAYSAGIVSEWHKPSWYEHNDRNSFQFLSLNPMWASKKECDGTGRPHGYFHTDSMILDQDEAFQVSIPLEFNLSGTFSPESAERIRNWPLIRMSILKLIPEKKPKHHQRASPALLKEVKSKFFSVRDLQLSKFNSESSTNTETHVSVNFRDLIVSDVVRLRKRSNYRIRIEWGADNICGETAFSLRIGDQIQISRSASHN
ncbi:MAG: hypothetical protein ABI041_03485 [Bdellovibrionia bacterium]